MLEARQLGRADVEKEGVALPRLTLRSTQRGWLAGTQSLPERQSLEARPDVVHALPAWSFVVRCSSQRSGDTES